MPQHLRMALILLTFAVACVAAPLAHAQDEDSLAYDVEAFNEGLEPLDSPYARETPQATMELLLSSADMDDYARAAHALNLNHLPAEEQKQKGPVLAKQLVYLLESELLVDWGKLPDLPDARVVPARETVDQKISQPFPRRSIRLGVVTGEGRPVPVTLQRYRLPDGALVWAFSPFTVDHIGALYEEHGPGLLERQFPDHTNWGSYANIAVWEWGVLVGLLVAAVVLHKLIYTVLRLLARVVRRDWAEAVMACCQRPLSWLFSALALLAAASMLMPLDGTLTSHIDVVLMGATFLLATWTISRVATAVTTSLAVRGPAADPDGEQLARTYQTNIAVARRVVLFLALVVGVGFLLSYLQVFETVGMSLLASTGAFAVVLGLAARPVLSGLVESVQIALTKPIEIGDVVEIDDRWGRIEDIRFMYSVLRTWTQKRVIIPHTYLLNTPYENWSKQEKSVARVVELPVDLSTDLDALRSFYQEVLPDDPRWADKVREVSVAEVGDSAMWLWFWVMGRNASESWYLAADVREELVKWLQQQDGRYLPHERHIVAGERGADGRKQTRRVAAGRA